MTRRLVDRNRRLGAHVAQEQPVAVDAVPKPKVAPWNPADERDAGRRDVGHDVARDGHAINEPLFGTARFDRGAGIPLEMVDHIEVILGPGSVLYGSNAMLGVINVITKLRLSAGNFDVDVGAKIFRRQAPYDDTDLVGPVRPAPQGGHPRRSGGRGIMVQ